MDLVYRQKMVYFLVLLFLLIFISCSEESGCEKIIREIDFLESYSEYDESTIFNISEVENSIGFLEEISGIQGSDGGELNM